LPVEVDGRADQGQVGEGLGEGAEELPALADLPELDLRVDLAPAILMFRVLIVDERMDPDDTVRQLCALVLGEDAAS
jgi:hypothetical protein